MIHHKNNHFSPARSWKETIGQEWGTVDLRYLGGAGFLSFLITLSCQLANLKDESNKAIVKSDEQLMKSIRFRQKNKIPA
jgi:hypothetical protein